MGQLSKKDKLFSFSIAALIISLLVFYTWKQSVEKRKLEYFEMTEGKVIEFHYSNYRKILKYTYKVNQQVYVGSVGSDNFNCEDGTPGCVGKTFPVKYAIDDPSISEIDLGKFSDKKHKKIAF
jgi:hypothetical protein